VGSPNTDNSDSIQARSVSDGIGESRRRFGAAHAPSPDVPGGHPALQELGCRQRSAILASLVCIRRLPGRGQPLTDDSDCMQARSVSDGIGIPRASALAMMRRCRVTTLAACPGGLDAFAASPFDRRAGSPARASRRSSAKPRWPGWPCSACIQSRRSSSRRLRASSRDRCGIAYRTPTLSVMETLPSAA